jgi:two-component system sensor histidine kinase YesM
MSYVNIRLYFQNKLEEANEMTAVNAHSFIEENINESKDIIDNVYTNKTLYSEIIYLMENGYNKHLEHKMDKLFKSQENKFNGFENYFNSCLIRNSSMTGISICSLKQDEVFVYNLKTGVVFPKNSDETNILEQSTESFDSLKIMPSHKAHYLESQVNVFSIAYCVKERFTTSNLGFIIIDYEINSLKNKLSISVKEFQGRIAVFTLQGGIIFDTAGKPEYKNLFSDLKNNITSSDTYKSNMIHTVTSASTGILTAAVLPKQAIYTYLSMLTKTIFFIAGICILAILLLTTFAIKRFSTRIASLVQGIKTIKKGDLSYRIEVEKNGDELSEIAVSFNGMCQDLKNYIDKAYMADIKQKNAQIKVLQSQINPHLLYNTLESIRMRVLAGDDKEAGEMIYLLASFYRSTIKEKMVISISEEAKYAKMYLELHNIKSINQISVIFDVDEELSDFGILKHTLQPLIENFICHGINMDREDNQLIIKVCKENGDICILIEDNGTGISKEKLDTIKKALKSGSESQIGIGIKNVHERIVLLFGDGYGLKIMSSLGQGTAVYIGVPAILKEEMEQYVQSFHRR